MTRCLLVVGLSHHSAPVAVRERVAITAEELPRKLAALAPDFDERLILSTCNRTEIYAAGPGPAALAQLVAFLRNLHPGHDEHLEPHLYTHTGDDALLHLFRVAAGLDSMLLGEVEIARQLRDAYDASLAAGSAGTLLHRAVPRAMHVGKRVRNETAISRGVTSLAGAAAELLERVLPEGSGHSIVTAGAGRSVETGLKVLRPRARGRLVITNRTGSRAESLAQAFDGIAAPLEDLPRLAADADVVLAATGTRDPILRAEDLGPRLAGDRPAPLLILDLGVPRNVDPALGERSDVRLFDIDDLRCIARRGRESRSRELPRAEALVRRAATDFLQQLDEREAGPDLRALHDGMLRIRDDILMARSSRGRPEREALDLEADRAADRLLRRAAPRIKDGTVSPQELFAAYRSELEPLGKRA